MGVPLTAAQKAEARRLRKRGPPYRVIGEVVGCSMSAALRWSHDVVPHREPAPGAVDRLQRIERWYARINETMAEVRA